MFAIKKEEECKGFSCDHSLSEQCFILYIDSLKCWWSWWEIWCSWKRVSALRKLFWALLNQLVNGWLITRRCDQPEITQHYVLIEAPLRAQKHLLHLDTPNKGNIESDLAGEMLMGSAHPAPAPRPCCPAWGSRRHGPRQHRRPLRNRGLDTGSTPREIECSLMFASADKTPELSTSPATPQQCTQGKSELC